MKVILISSLLLTANTCKKKGEEASILQEERKTEVVATSNSLDVSKSESTIDATKKEEIRSNSQASTITKLVLPEKNEQPVAKVVSQEKGIIAEYEALSRGMFLKIRYSNGQLLVSKNRDNSQKGDIITLTKLQNEELDKLLSNIKPEKLETMQAPTEARLYDGAAHANMTIIAKGKTYTCPGFDHGHPPAGIEKFVQKLLSYTQNN